MDFLTEAAILLCFAIFAAPIFLWLRERAEPHPLPEGETILSIAFKRLRHTISTVREYREFIKYMIAFLIYNDGILMTLNFAAIFGAAGFSPTGAATMRAFMPRHFRR